MDPVNTPGTPASPATPATPSTPAAPPSTPATPVHSSDRALANFTGNDPSKGGNDPKPVAVTPPAADPAQPAAPAAIPDGLTSLLDELIQAPDPAAPAAVVPDPAAPAVDPADPLAALKDNPRVIELQAHEAAVKDAMSASPEWIKEPAHLKAAVQDAAVLWEISTGKKKVDAILNPLKTVNPARHEQVLDEIKDYYQREKGTPIAAAAAGQPDPANMTPEQKEIYEIKKKLADRDAADKKAVDDAARAAQVKRVADTKAAVTTKIGELLKGTVFEGEAERFFAMTGPIIGQDKVPQLIDAVEKGDFKLVEMAIKKAQSAESVRLKTVINRLIEMQKKKGTTIPPQSSGNSPAAGSDPATPATSNSRDVRLKAMADTLKTA